MKQPDTVAHFFLSGPTFPLKYFDAIDPRNLVHI